MAFTLKYLALLHSTPFGEKMCSLTDEQRVIQWNIEDEEREMANGGFSLWSTWEVSRRRHRIERLKMQLKKMSPSTAVLKSIFPRVEGGIDEYIEAGIDNWRDCTRTMQVLARATKIEIVSILQPIPERLKPLTKRERRYIEAQPDVLTIRARGYTRLTAHAAELAKDGIKCLDFANVFAGQSEDMYADIGHLNDQACQVVARRIATEAVGGVGVCKKVAMLKKVAPKTVEPFKRSLLPLRYANCSQLR